LNFDPTPILYLQSFTGGTVSELSDQFLAQQQNIDAAGEPRSRLKDISSE